VASFYDNLWRGRGAELTRHERDRFVSILGLLRGLPRPNSLILDAGCGAGKLASLLKAYGEVTAVDWSEGGLEVARSRVEGVDFRRLDLVRDGLGAFRGRFGTTVSSEVLEHVGQANQQAFVRGLAETLAPRGFLILTTPNRRIVEALAHLPALEQPEEHLLYPEETLDLLSKAGLVVRAQRSATFLERAWEHSSVFRRLRSALPRAGLGPDLVDRILSKTTWGIYQIVCAQRP
jgi:2-polyprenyl-3-methyl-5-hydroxy-6-metoxy-1,4-benzoquinol methylase